jgi:hypothetical protein
MQLSIAPTLSDIAKCEQRQITLSRQRVTVFLPDFLLPFGRLISAGQPRSGFSKIQDGEQ